MKTKEYIDLWKRKKIITAAQAREMMATVEVSGSSRWVSIITLIGSFLIGAGVISYVAANWSFMSDAMRILILIAGNGLLLGSGYYLLEVNKGYPKVGSGLLFLSSLFFGATIVLLSQIFNIRSDDTVGLFSLWLLGVLPATYLFRLKSLALSSAVLFIALVFSLLGAWDVLSDDVSFAVLLSSGLFLMGVGLLHRAKSVVFASPLYYVVGVVLFSALAYGLSIEHEMFSDASRSSLGLLWSVFALGSAPLIVSVFGSRELKHILMLLFSVIAMTAFVAAPGSLGLAVFWVYNCCYLAYLLGGIYFANRNGDVMLYHIHALFLFVYVFTKYMQTFHDYLNGGLFFIVSGILLIVGGLFLEKRLRAFRSSH